MCSADFASIDMFLKFRKFFKFSEILKSMFEKSPIFHADKIEAPMFLMIGKNDLRVPPDQGRELYHHLKSQGKEVYMNIYEDCHPLAKIPVHSDVLVNAALFFESVLTFGCQWNVQFYFQDFKSTRSATECVYEEIIFIR